VPIFFVSSDSFSPSADLCEYYTTDGVFCHRPKEPDSGDKDTIFFVTDSLVGGRAHDQDKMNIAWGIYVQRTRSIFAIFPVGTLYFFKNHSPLNQVLVPGNAGPFILWQGKSRWQCMLFDVSGHIRKRL
jgi:hypothetical protein